jgi:hypothetical protein
MWIEYYLETCCGNIEAGTFNADRMIWFGCTTALEFKIHFDDKTLNFNFESGEMVLEAIKALKTAICFQQRKLPGNSYIRAMTRIFSEDTTLIPSAYQGSDE